MKSRKVLSVAGAIVGSALLVAGCGPEDQARPLNYKKGVYLGKPHTPLSERTLDELRARAGYQSGVTAAAGGGWSGGQAPSSSVRSPATGDIDTDALRRRAGQQSGTTAPAGGGGDTVSLSGASSVRPPSTGGIDMNALRQRAGRQRQ